MDDLDVLARDFGFRRSGKSAPMRSDSEERATTGRSSSSPFVDDHGHGGDDMLFNDVFGGPPKYTNSNSNKSSISSLPVYDKPVYDDNIFDGLPGLKSKSTSTSAGFDDDVFSSMASPPKPEHIHDFDDLLGNLGKTEKSGKVDQKTNSKTSVDFDDLLSGFGTANSARNKRPSPESNHPPETDGNLNQMASNVMDDPFGVLESTSAPGLFSDPLEEINKLNKSANTKVDTSSFPAGMFDDLDPLNTFGKAAPAFSFNINNKEIDVSSKEGSTAQAFAGNEAVGKSSSRYSENPSQKVSIDNSYESHQTFFDMPNMSTDSQRSFGQNASSPSNGKSNLNAMNSQADMSPRSSEQVEPSDDVWLTVSEIPLFTQPTRVPPPSRDPPPIPRYGSKSEIGSFASSARNQGNEFSSAASRTHRSKSPMSVHLAAKNSVVSSIDKLEDFVVDRSRGSMDENTIFQSVQETNANSVAAASAAAMKEAMDRAEAKFSHAKEVREYAKATRSKESVQLERDEEAREAQEREREKQKRLEQEQRQREEEERRRRLERERQRAEEIERENARRAVERATKEARERAASEALERAAAEARMKAERAAVEKANVEARERAERAAVQSAQAKARERAAAEARERAERVATEARERMNAEAREKEAREKAAVARAEVEARRRAERAAVEKAAAEVRERAAAEARERAAAAARSQQNNDNDLESFFSMGSRASSAPRPGTKFSDPVSDLKSHSRGGPEGAKRPFSSGGSSSNMKKSSSTTNIVDDLSSIFGAAPSSGEFREVEGESEERRRVRLERHQRTQERAAKAVAEKNQRDLQTQREQEERHRIAEALDIEIKRWGAGKEGNLRALLSTLQYVLWPECGWQPISLTDLITGASVKKAYRKATLCIHPDKVQQKGANIQQKYIAEKVFDLLKEAWNKFNSEELY